MNNDPFSSIDPCPNVSTEKLLREMKKIQGMMPKEPIYRAMVVSLVDRANIIKHTKKYTKPFDPLRIECLPNKLCGVDMFGFNFMPEGTGYSFTKVADAIKFMELVEGKMKKFQMEPKIAIAMVVVEMNLKDLTNVKIQTEERQTI